MSGEFDLSKYSTKFEQRPWILVKLSFRELCDSKLSGLRPFDNMAIYELKIGEKQKDRLLVHETPIIEVIFMTLT